jgi:hypothetical protein
MEAGASPACVLFGLLQDDCFKPAKSCLHEKDNVSDFESSGLAGLKAFIWSNLCTRV